MQRLIRRPHVSEMTGLPRTTLYAAIAEERFPAPVRIGRRAVAWREADVLQWLASRPDARA